MALLCPFDVNVSQRAWTAEESAVAKEVALLKRNLGKRVEVSVMLVLVQNCDYPRDLEVPKKVEIKQDRVNSLRRLCDIAAKNIVLLHTADFFGTASPAVVQLHARMKELAEEYYAAQGRRLRGYLKLLDKSTVGGLAMAVRINFKVAQIYETRKSSKALKHYEDAYDSVVELVERAGVEGFPYGANEVRCVAESVHYRLIVLHVSSRHVHSVLGQFKKHMSAMKKVKGEFQQRFLYHQWLSKQYFIFSEFIAEIRPALALAHITPLDRFRCNQLDYLITAANHAIRRRKVAQTLKVYGGAVNAAQDQALRKRTLDGLLKKHRISLVPAEYIGAAKRCVSSERGGGVVDPAVEEEVTRLACQEAEGLHNQSAQVLSLLSQVSSLMSRSMTSASTQSQAGKEQPSGLQVSRREAQVSLLIAQEHLCMGNTAVAFSYLDKCVEVFRQEQWYEPIALPIHNLLNNADDLRSEDEVVASTRLRKSLLGLFLLALSPCMRLELETQQRMEMERSLFDWTKLPFPEDHPREELLFIATQQSGENVFFWSSEASLTSDASVAFTLHLRTIFVRLPITACKVGFNDPRYDFTLRHEEADDAHDSDLQLDEDRCTTTRLDGLKMGGALHLTVRMEPIGIRKEKATLYATSVTLVIGEAFGGRGSILLASNLAGHVARHAAQALPGAVPLSLQRVNATAVKLAQPLSEVKIEGLPETALIGQVCPMKVRLTGTEATVAQSSKLTLEVVGDAQLFERINGVWEALNDATLMENGLDRNFGVGAMGSAALSEVKVEVKALVELSTSASVNVDEVVTFTPPFKATMKVVPLELESSNLQPFVENGQPFLLQVGLESMCDTALVLHAFEIKADNGFVVEAQHVPFLPLPLEAKEKYVAVMVVKAAEATDASTIGSVSILWKCTNEEKEVNRFTARLPNIEVRQPPFRFKVEAGNATHIGGYRDVVLSVQNTTQAVQKVVATLMEGKEEIGPFDAAEMNEDVFFVGECQHELVIAPDSTEKAQWKLVETSALPNANGKVYIKAVATRYDSVHYFTV